MNYLILMKRSGIYKIQSQVRQERFYIGSAVNLKGRMDVHINDLKKNKHHSKQLQRHYNKYGESDLIFSVLIECGKEELIDKEQYFLDIYNPYFNSYKIAGSPLGSKHSDQTKLIMSISRMGRVISEEQKEKISGANKGHIHSDESKILMSTKRKGGTAWNKGKSPSDEYKQKISEGLKGNIPWNKGKKSSQVAWNKGQKGVQVPWNKGIPMSEEQKVKISQSKRGKTAWNKGVPMAEDVRLKRTGLFLSEETKRKISEKAKGRKRK